MASQQTINEVLQFTRFNSGTHFLDSGGAYGRQWQSEAPKSMFEAPCIDDDYFGGVSVSLTHIIAEHWSFDEELQGLIDELWSADKPVVIEDVDTWSMDRLLEKYKDLYECVEIIGGDEEECTHDVKVDGTGLDLWDVGTIVMVLKGYVQEARDNAYNNENDLDQVFVWECWVPADEFKFGSDWIYAPNAILMVYAHTGCDVRGGYAKPMALECESSDAEYNLIECRVGYYPADDITLAICEDEGIEDQFSVGYSSSPSYHLESTMGSFVRWERDGDIPVAVFTSPVKGDTTEMRFVPDYHP